MQSDSTPTSPKEVGLQEFTGFLERAVKAFKDSWEKEHKQAPETWPVDMPAAEWHEQFIVWLEDYPFKDTTDD